MSESRSELEEEEMNTDESSEAISFAEKTHMPHAGSENTEQAPKTNLEDAQPECLNRRQPGVKDEEVVLSGVTGANTDTEWVFLGEGEKDNAVENDKDTDDEKDQRSERLGVDGDILDYDKEHANTLETTDVPIDKEHNSKPETADVQIDKEHVSDPEKADVQIDNAHSSDTETSNGPIDKDYISDPETPDVQIDTEHISDPETADVQKYNEHISDPETADVQKENEHISDPETADVQIDNEHSNDPETADVQIDNKLISDPETTYVPIHKGSFFEPETMVVSLDTEALSKSETTDVSLDEEFICKADTLDETIDKEHISKLDTKDLPIDTEHVNTPETTDVSTDKEPISESETIENAAALTDNKDSNEIFSSQSENICKDPPELDEDVSNNEFSLGVILPRETKTEDMSSMCVDDEQSMEEETATPTPQEDTTKTSFDLPEFSTSSLTLLKQSEDGKHVLVSCNITPQVLGVSSESPGEPKEDEAFVVWPKPSSTGDAGLSPIREDLENSESVASKEDTFQKHKDVTNEVKDVAFKGNVQNIGVVLDSFKNEGKSTQADNAPRDITPSNTEQTREISKDSIKDESSSNSNTDIAVSSQCPTEDRAQEKVKPSSVNMSRMILLISLVIVTGVVSAVAVPFALMFVGFEEGGIVAGSLAESLMEYASSISFGMFIFEILEEVGSFNVAAQIIIGLLSGGFVGGVLLASGLFRHKGTSKEMLGDRTNEITDTTERKDDNSTKEHNEIEIELAQAQSRIGNVGS